MTPDRYGRAFFGRQDEASTEGARALVPRLAALVPTRSVVDVGCGTGAFLREFQRQGTERILGLDGPWIDGSLLRIDAADFRAIDFEASLPTDVERADLALSLEVAEHLGPERGDGLVATLCGISDVVVFGAAIPGQDGDHHVNEQWPGYWAERFRSHGFDCFDFLRPALWTDPAIPYWYAQNTLVFAKDRELPCPVAEPLALVHPRLFTKRSRPLSARQHLVQASQQIRRRFDRRSPA